MLPLFLYNTILMLLLPLEGEQITFLRGEQFREWLNEVRKSHAYPLFGILMSLRSHMEAATVVKDLDYRSDIARISGGDCCFLYLHAEESEDETAYLEHVDRVYEIADILQMEKQKLPCFLFFDKLAPDRSIDIRLHGKNADDIVEETSRIFDFIRRSHDGERLSAFEALQNYKSNRGRYYTAKAAWEFVVSTGIRFGVEFIKSQGQ